MAAVHAGVCKVVHHTTAAAIEMGPPCTAVIMHSLRHSHSAITVHIVDSSSSRTVSDGQKEYSSATTGDRSALRLASPREQRGLPDSSRSTTSFAYHRPAGGKTLNEGSHVFLGLRETVPYIM